MASSAMDDGGSARLAADREDVRAEYASLNAYSSTIVTFRFTLVGFFLAAVGLVVQGGVQRDEAMLLLALSLCLWILELRNRALLMNLSGRAIQIEREIWGYTGPQSYDAFACRQLKVHPADDEDAPSRPPADKTRILFWEVRLPARLLTHTIGLDFLYLTVIIYAVATAA